MTTTLATGVLRERPGIPGTAVRPHETAEMRGAASALLAYCRERDWSGADPYDGLNSRLFNRTFLSRSKTCRLALIQLLKRLPVDLRPLLLVPAGQNPKALGLFLSALLKLERMGLAQDGEARGMVDRIAALRSPGTSSWCWGYHFPWQTRTDLVPKHAPNLVCTVFVADALLDAHEQLGLTRCAQMASSAAAYIHEELFWTEGNAAGFCYPFPRRTPPIHNANFLAAALLARVAALTGNRSLREAGLAAARYSLSWQRRDGSWFYGEGPNQHWVDNFHTGFNLCALADIGRYAETAEFDESLRRGYAFYREHFFRNNGAPRYFHDRDFPFDVHSAAQSIITMSKLQDPDEECGQRAEDVLHWSLDHLRDKKGFFYYQEHPLYRNRISYMRWSQAWMLLALATLLEKHADVRKENDSERGPRGNEGEPMQPRNKGEYVLVTPARNEAAMIEGTIRSVIRQTQLPRKWVIVSDGSTDGTDEIVERYLSDHPWIELVKLPDRRERHFAGKVEAFNAGYARVRDLSFEVIGSLDADITFDRDYFAFLMDRFADDPQLGVAGTPFREGTRQYDYRFTSIDHVSGACQLFRRECFTSIGGYHPIKGGGIDWVAVTTARMQGWTTRTFTDKVCLHHRSIGTGTGSALRARFRFGRQDYYLGGHPLWEVFRSAYQMMTSKPVVLGGLTLLAGYVWAALSRAERPISAELVAFRRREQMERLKRFLFGSPKKAA
ncbi:MAG: glycosyltransferase family 2 protein [Nitrospiraceae bacterium]|nr:glycosyltransferase family 2 protein [Nitrospiraceae bacterium]